ncbi:MAG: serine/threonine-protein kinase [Bacteroidota bacterium]
MPQTLRTPVFHRYEVRLRIGSGGMGTVYRAYDREGERPVALKVLPPGLQDDPEAMERFRREAAALGRVRHPGVAEVFEASVAQGFPYLAMAFVAGPTLEDRLRTDGLLPISEAIQLAQQVAEALDAIHAAGIVHRDIKTSNIVLGRDGQAVLVDFGIAYRESLPRLSHGAVGTPEYMSPEQADGAPLDGRSDLYSLGVVLFECLTGQVPFPRQGESVAEVLDLLDRVQTGPVASARAQRPEVPVWLDRLVARCLAKRPEDRYATGQALVHALQEQAASGPESGASPPAPGPRHTQRTRRGRRRTARIGRRPGTTVLAHPAEVHALALCPDDAQVITVCADRALRVWDAERGHLCQTVLHDEAPLTVAISPSGRLVATGDRAGQVRLWARPAWTLHQRLDAHAAVAMTMAFSPDGTTLATGGADGFIRLWSVRDGRLLDSFTAHTGYVMTVAYHPDGGTLWTGGTDGLIHAWTLPHAGEVAPRSPRVLGRHKGYVINLAIDTQGQRLVSGGSDGAVRVWDLQTQTLARTLGWHRAWIMAVAFSPDGTSVLSAGRDHQLRRWRLHEGELAQTVRGHTAPVTGAAFGRRAPWMASCSEDGTVRLWPLDLPTPAAYPAARRWSLALVLLAVLAMATWQAPQLAGPMSTETRLAGPSFAGDDAPATVTQVPETPAPVQVERPPRTRPSGPLYGTRLVGAHGGWTLVVRAVSTEQAAQRQATTYRRRGYRTGVLARHYDGAWHYHVGVGQFAEYGAARAAQRRLAGQALPSTVWLARIHEDHLR